MGSIRKYAVLFLLIIFSAVDLIAQPGLSQVIQKEISRVIEITNDSIILATGSTYAYTVDTPEGEGLVSTGLKAEELISGLLAAGIRSADFQVRDVQGNPKTKGEILPGDKLIIHTENRNKTQTYVFGTRRMALPGRLVLENPYKTSGTKSSIRLAFTAGQRTPRAGIHIHIPEGIEVNINNTTVNVIGRGEVLLKDLAVQPIGRTGNNYSYSKVGEVSITKSKAGGSVLSFNQIDLRPASGVDILVEIKDVVLNTAGAYLFSANYSTTEPEQLTSAGTGTETAMLTVSPTVADFQRLPAKIPEYKESRDIYSSANFCWSPAEISDVLLEQSVNNGKSWQKAKAKIDLKSGRATVSGLRPDQRYQFRLLAKAGANKGYSNLASFYSGKMDIKSFGLTGNGDGDDTEKINAAISHIHQLGGGTLLFSPGTYNVRTIYLKSNVWLYVKQGAFIKALKGGDEPETTWFSDRKYRSGLSPTDTGPYDNPENWLTKQDVGHTYFRNAMFFGERLDNVKIIGNGTITGDGNLVTSDKVMNNPRGNRCDKMFSFKLCTNLEIGGLHRDEDLWYDPAKDEPFYFKANDQKDFNTGNMLQIDRGGHFVLLATGTDNIVVHDTYFAKEHSSNARDIYDFMGCNNVTVRNIYSKVSSDDIVKPGSDCSLGFTRPAQSYKIRNIIGDTNCNLFQIGSETADDIRDICVDNIYVLGANKAGFSISTNDGGHVKNIHLNCGHTGPVKYPSQMYRTTTPFFISISNRGRVLGAAVKRFKFEEYGKNRDELLVTNINIGRVDSIYINNVHIQEVYGGSSFGSKERWKLYDGSQRTATAIVAGYNLPSNNDVVGGLNFQLPDGRATGYINHIQFENIRILVKGGHAARDTSLVPPELGVGQYNVSNLGVQPAYGLWARHVKNLVLEDSRFDAEKADGRYALFLDDVRGARLWGIQIAGSDGTAKPLRTVRVTGLKIQDLSRIVSASAHAN